MPVTNSLSSSQKQLRQAICKSKYLNYQAIFLLGPTGSGKSPLGECLERVVLWGRRSHHFDFGANLRAMAASRGTGAFTAQEVRFLRNILQKGALLENKHFPLAARILEVFITQKGVRPYDLIVLNGLPRHLQQARRLEQRLTVIYVVQLECDPRTVLERLRCNSGGDRAQRQDDAEVLVARKLAVYEKRTLPLVNHYRKLGVSILNVKVGVGTQPAEIVARMQDWRKGIT